MPYRLRQLCHRKTGGIPPGESQITSSGIQAYMESGSKRCRQMTESPKMIDRGRDMYIIIFTYSGVFSPEVVDAQLPTPASQAGRPAATRDAESPASGRHSSLVPAKRFHPQDLLQVKYERLRQVHTENPTGRQAALAFGFSRPSFYHAQVAFEQGGLPGLLPRKRGPQHAHKLTAEVMQFLARARAAEPGLSAPELAQPVQEHFGVRVPPRTVGRRLRRLEKKR